VTTTNPDPLRLEYTANFEYSYAIGKHATKFMTALRDEAKLFGISCPSCHDVLVPPRPVCGRCGVETDGWVEVGPRGTLTGYTVVEIPFIDPMTGAERPFPYGFAFVKLAGASTNIYHFLSESRHDHLSVGMEVEAVFKEEREGSLADIINFKPVLP
jgi:uncharacterized OB-fold protein